MIKVWIDEGFKHLDEYSELVLVLNKNCVDICTEKLPIDNSIMWTRIKSFDNTNNDVASNIGN